MNLPTDASRLGRLGNWLADHANPLVVKEVRQALRGRSFLIWFLLLNVFGGGAAILAAGIHERGITSGPIGGGLFTAYFGALLFVTWGVLPLNAFFGLSQETEDRTMELVGITQLSAAAIVRGKLVATLIQTALYTVALLPFLAFSFLLRGIDVITILVLLVAATITAVWYTVVAVFFASIVPNRVMRWLVGAILAMSLVSSVMITTGTTFAIVQLQIIQNVLTDLLRREVLLPILGAVLLLVSYGVLFFFLAVGQLSFHSANRSTIPRLILLLQWVGVSIVMLVTFDWDRATAEIPAVYGFYCIAVFYITGILAGAETEDVSRRTLRAVNRAPRIIRPFYRMLLPGGGRGLIFGATLGALSVCLTIAVLIWPSTFTNEVLPRFDEGDAVSYATIIMILWVYSLFFMATPQFLTRMVHPWVTPMALRGITLAAFPLTLMLSGIAWLVVPHGFEQWTQLLNPFYKVEDAFIRTFTLGTDAGNQFLLFAGLVSVAMFLAAYWMSRRVAQRRQRLHEPAHG